MTVNKKNTPDLFVKIHHMEQLTEDKISLDVEVIAVDDQGAVASQPIELTMNEKNQQLATMANGILKTDLVFPIYPDRRQYLTAKIHGLKESSSITEIVPKTYEEKIEERKESEFTEREKLLRKDHKKELDKINKTVANLKLEIEKINDMNEKTLDQALKKQKEELEREHRKQAAAIEKKLNDKITKLKTEFAEQQDNEILIRFFEDFLDQLKSISKNKSKIGSKKKDNVVDFYRKLLVNHTIPDSDLGSIRSLRQKIIKESRDLKIVAQKTIAFLNVAKTWSNDHNASLIDKIIKILKEFPDEIEDHKFIYPDIYVHRSSGKIMINSKPAKTMSSKSSSKTKTIRAASKIIDVTIYRNKLFMNIDATVLEQINTGINKIKDRQRKMIRIYEIFEECIGENNFYLCLADAVEENHTNPFPAIADVIRDFPEDEIVVIYNVLYPQVGFVNHDDVVQYETKRLRSMISGMPSEKIEEIEKLKRVLKKRISDKDFIFAWRGIEDTIKIIKSSPEIVEALGFEQFESKWGYYIERFGNRFKVKEKAI